jgi:hypothetical protein
MAAQYVLVILQLKVMHELAIYIQKEERNSAVPKKGK